MATAAELRAEHARLRAEKLAADQAWRATQDAKQDAERAARNANGTN